MDPEKVGVSKMSRQPPRDYRKIIKPLLKAGWSLTGGGRKHFRLHPPVGDHDLHPLTFPSSPGAPSGLANFRAAVKRHLRVLGAESP